MADDKPDPKRDALHDAIQQHGRYDETDGAMLTGWVMVAEWMDQSGERWLSKGHAAHTAHWSAKGMMHEALYGDWPDPDEED